MVEVSVIVPTLKERDEIACIPCFERDEFTDYEVVVRDDEGASRARNKAIEEADAEKLVFLDDDSYPMRGYLREASAVLDEEAAVAGRIIHPYDDIFDKFTHYYDHGDEPRYVDNLVGCNMALRREVFETVGGFDEDFSWGHEESELAYRVAKAYDIYYEPDLQVRHCYAESVLGLWKKHYDLETQRSTYWDKKNLPKAEQFLRLAWWLLDPRFYVGDSIPHTAVKIGAHMAGNLGILKGLIENR